LAAVLISVGKLNLVDFIFDGETELSSNFWRLLYLLPAPRIGAFATQPPSGLLIHALTSHHGVV